MSNKEIAESFIVFFTYLDSIRLFLDRLLLISWRKRKLDIF